MENLIFSNWINISTKKDQKAIKYIKLTYQCKKYVLHCFCIENEWISHWKWWLFIQNHWFLAKTAIFSKKLTCRGRFRGVEYSTGSENFFLNYKFAKDVSKKISWKLIENWKKYRRVDLAQKTPFSGGSPLK